MHKTIMIGCMNGEIYWYNIKSQQLTIYHKLDKSGIMGLAWNDNHFFASSTTEIMKQPHGYRNKTDGVHKKFIREHPQFHQLVLHENKIYITCTRINEIWVFNDKLDIIIKMSISPPLVTKPIAQKINYNHINSICFYKGKFYVGLNWFTIKQYGTSGICVLDHDLNELYRFECGWETHGFTFIDNKQYTLCATSQPYSKITSHPIKSGLMVDGVLVFEHPINVFCKAFVVTENQIYLLGGETTTRERRCLGRGVIYILDRNYSLINTKTFENTGQFCSGLLL